jgi:hypothetical protein
VLSPGGILVFGVQDSFASPDILSQLIKGRHALRIRSRIEAVLGRGQMQMHCLREHAVRHALGSAKVVDIRFTNTAAKDFNGKLTYLAQAQTSGYVGRQYCVAKET